jgi:hypothetical membrane protein
MDSPRVLAARAAVAAQVCFVGGWLVVGVVEGDGYSALRHDISDLGALTAHHPTLLRLTLALSGALTIAFALVLRRHLGNAALVVALSLPGLDNLTDAFFRLDCRAADAGCSTSDALASWHGKAHVVSFVVAGLATLVAPFLLSRAMRRSDGWEDLAAPTTRFGLVTIAVLAATAATGGTAIQGLTQRIAAVVVVSGVALLAVRVVRLESRRAVSQVGQ